jgi:hypothetical protein
VPQKKLDLLEITARLPAKLGTATAKIVGAKMFDPSQPQKVSKPKKAMTALAKVSPKKNAAKKSAAA